MKFKEFLLESQDVIFVGSRDVKNGRFTKKYDKVTVNFDCSHNKLTTLEGGPSSVGEHFNCAHNQLTDLEGGPTYVGAGFNCSSNKLTSFNGCPSFINGDFYCFDNQLTNLEGSPIYVDGISNYAINQLTSLEGIGKRYLRQMNGKLSLNKNSIKSNVLGVLLIKGCKEIEMNNNKEVEDILNRHLKSDRDVIECREELIAAGFKEYAKL